MSFICCVYLVPDFLRGVHGVSKERVDRCVGHQDVNATALIQSLFQTPDETNIEVTIADNLIIMGMSLNVPESYITGS